MLSLNIRHCLTISIILSILVCIVVGYVALDHNPMGEFCNPVSSNNCDIIWINFVPLLIIWFAISFIVSMIILLALRYMIQKISNK